MGGPDADEARLHADDPARDERSEEAHKAAYNVSALTLFQNVTHWRTGERVKDPVTGKGIVSSGRVSGLSLRDDGRLSFVIEAPANAAEFYEKVRESAEKAGHYWAMRRDELVASRSPGYETEISIVDIDFDPAAIETDTLSIELTCCNRNLPASLSYGLPGGDLFLEGGFSGEMFFIFAKLQPILKDVRQKMQSPGLFKNVESVIMSTKAGRERLKLVTARVESRRKAMLEGAKAS